MAPVSDWFIVLFASAVTTLVLVLRHSVESRSEKPNHSSQSMNKSELQGNIFNRCQAQQNTQRVLSAGNHATSAKRGKTRANQVTIGFGLTPDWLNKRHVRCDWLEHVTGCFF